MGNRYGVPMATAKGKYPADMNIGLTHEMKADLSDIAWKNRTSMRDMLRTMLGTEIRIIKLSRKNPRVRELYAQLMAEINGETAAHSEEELREAYESGGQAYDSFSGEGREMKADNAPTFYAQPPLQEQFARGWSDRHVSVTGP